ncbi:carboxylesterase/lipase family protein [Piscinibacter sp. HJYY11]|uniref:carboxylesterase/lipase family protein n=1 Tax=Piscinibacter sp. HJYY11 TaxID=2801333 RepID=UPI00191F9F22|nr:carboxylesterase family protein [Piscinibacter sp. HJYY11]MBL0730072.1 carboxylesterase family protein [Piscinibacter sp. HJYY11]
MFQKIGRPRALGAAMAALMSVAACGSGDEGPATLTGTFIDSPVSGLSVQGPQLGARSTDAQGRFSYQTGETLTFAIGNLTLGSAPGAGTLTPLSITGGATAASDPRVANKLILLQTLDADGDLNNGIQITDAIRSVVSAQAATINFDQTTTAFRTSLGPLLSALNAANVFTDLDPRPRSARTAMAALDHFARSTSPRHVVTTTGGQLSGFEANANTWQFLGVPYARPPVGDLRWRPPQPAPAWTGVRHATAWANQSAQDTRLEAIGEGGMSEDSLYLNITAPKNAANLPVMVWFHGGAFAILTGNSKQYNNPESLTTKGVVLVTVNHRLGPFGYLSHPLLSAESGYNGSGNYGQMDLVMALQWVRDNIAAFGGNPGNVTLFGQSGGGGKTYSLMNSPQATGLFHKAIVQSGASPIATTGTVATSLAANEAIGTALFARNNVTTLAQARALPWQAIVQADIDNAIPRETYRPNADYHYLPKTYAQNVTDGMPSDVPLMVGVTSGDYSTLRGALPIFLTQRTPTYQSPQYVYKFSRVPDGWAAMGLLSAHGGELPYLFNFPMGHVSNYSLNLVLLPNGTRPPIGDLNGNGITGTAGDSADVYASMQWGADDVTTVDLLMTMWTNFARTGNPSAGGVSWPAYTVANDTFVEVGPTPTATVRTGLAAAVQ